MQTIGRYQVIRELGRGAMGLVYLAEDPAIGRRVAIKTINLENLSEPGQEQLLRERLMREARSAGILSHPGIVTIYDITHAGHTAYIVMEYVEGKTLYDKMSDGPLDSKELLSVLEQTAAALDYAHGKGVLHRDIKPANVMVAVDGTVKIMDFGIARLNSQKTATTSAVLGTPSYMAPEQISGKPVTKATDQFSLAVMAYELITGVKPFAGDSMSALLYSVVFHEARPVKELNATMPAAVENVLCKAMAKDAEQRYPSCMEFVKAFRAACDSKKPWRANPTVRGSAASAAVPQEFVSGGPQWTPTPSAPLHTPLPAAPQGRAVTPAPPVRQPTATPLPALVHAASSARTTAARPHSNRLVVGVVVAVVASFCGWVLYATRSIPEPGRTASGSEASSGSPDARANDPKAAATAGVVTPEPPPAKPAAGSPPGKGEPAPPASPGNSPGATTAAGSIPANQSSGLIPVEVTSTPPLAKVSSGGTECVTPCTLELARGEKYVKAELAGYKTVYQRIQVPNQTELAIKLEPAVGWIDVGGPEGSVVYIDSRPWAKPAPVSIPVSPGEHVVYLVYPGNRKSNEQRLNIREDVRYQLMIEQ